MKETFAATGPLRLDVRVEAGSIEIEARPTDTVEVEVEPRNDFAESLMGDVRVAQHGEELVGEARFNTASGDVSIEHAGGPLVLNSASGDLSIGRATGRLTARLVSG